jgi:hypothetical protein
MTPADEFPFGAPRAQGNKAVYTAPSSAVSLVYEVLEDGLKEVVVLESEKSPNTFNFNISHPGLGLYPDWNTRTWGFSVSEIEDPLLVLGGLSVCDSSRNDMGEPAFCEGAVMIVQPGEGASTVTIKVPQAWLSDPARKFPVFIDPSITQPASADTFIYHYTPTTAYGSYEFMSASYSPSYGTRRALVKFDVPTEAIGGWVQSAELKLYQYEETPAPTGSSTVWVAQMNTGWSEATTWNSLGVAHLGCEGHRAILGRGRSQLRVLRVSSSR